MSVNMNRQIALDAYNERSCICTPTISMLPNKSCICSQTNHEILELPLLPYGTQPLSHQIAGRRYGQGKNPYGVLQENDTILKPVQDPPKGPRELKFYQNVFSENTTNVLRNLRQFLPKYMGTFESDVNPDVVYIRLEDVTKQFRHPCIADIKMGPQTYDPIADEDKIRRESCKYAHLQKVGFQLLGMRVYNSKTGNFDVYNKKYGRSLDEHQMLTQGIGRFFNIESGLQKYAIKIFLSKMKDIENWFIQQKQISFYASSLLLVYEGSHVQTSEDAKDIYDTNDTNDLHSFSDNTMPNGSRSLDVKSSQELSLVDLKMIDFAHAFQTNDTDENYLYGLRSLMKYLQDLLDM